MVVNLVVGQLPSDLVERDISDNSLYTVSDTSVDYLSALERELGVELIRRQNRHFTITPAPC